MVLRKNEKPYRRGYMRIIHLSQQNDREAWLQMRRGKIGGTTAKGVTPLSRGADRTPQGFWKLLAEKLSVEADGEPVMDRGLRLENESLARTAKQFNLNLDLDPGMWISDDNEDISLSPDGSEADTDKPTYAVESKSLSSDNHLKHVVLDLRARKQDGYNPINQVPKDYREQCLQYFVVNQDLQTLYFTLYDDRIALDDLVHHVIIINREDVLGGIVDQRRVQIETLEKVNRLIEELTEGKWKTN
jgi:hypothetical protein